MRSNETRTALPTVQSNAQSRPASTAVHLSLRDSDCTVSLPFHKPQETVAARAKMMSLCVFMLEMGDHSSKYLVT